MRRRHPAVRYFELGLGGVLLLVAAALFPVPAPAAMFPFAGGMTLILRNSRRAQRGFVRIKRRRPRIGGAVDLAMRRRSALRRRARAKAAPR